MGDFPAIKRGKEKGGRTAGKSGEPDTPASGVCSSDFGYDRLKRLTSRGYPKPRLYSTKSYKNI